MLLCFHLSIIRFKSVLQQDCLIGYANPANTLVKSFVLVESNSIAHAVRGASWHCPGGPRTVPVRSAWPGTKALTGCSPPQRANLLRTGTVRSPGAVARCARSFISPNNTPYRLAVA